MKNTSYSKGQRVETTESFRVMGPGCWINIQAGTQGTVSAIKSSRVYVHLDNGLAFSFPRTQIRHS
jgi:hypothetical protein